MTRAAFWTAPDGVRLRYHDHPDRPGPPPVRLPVVCLPGLSRAARDFDPLAAWLDRRLIRPEMRGRGGSDRADPATYTVAHEVGDILGLLDALGVTRAAFVGTSRGGLQTMALAAARPGLVAAAVLNDVGPVLDAEALRVIAAVLSATPHTLPDWATAAAMLRGGQGAAFDLDDAGWDAFARRLFADEGGRPARDFDPALADATRAALAQPLPDLWPLFDALAGIPTLVIRGANSVVLTAATLDAMRARRPDLRAVEVPGRGHAPFLDEPAAVEAIRALLAQADAGAAS